MVSNGWWGWGGMYGLGGSAMASWCWKLVLVGTQLALVDVVKKKSPGRPNCFFRPLLCVCLDPEVTRVS